MRKKIIGRPNALQKLNSVAPGVLNQQGTTRNVYHLLKWTLDRSFEFFTNLNNTNQLFKNIDQNKLALGEALVVKRIFFPVFTMDPMDPTILNSVETWDGAGLANIIAGKLDITVGNQTIIKDLPISKAYYWCKNSSNYSGFAIELESEFVITQNTDFKVNLKQAGKFNGGMLVDNLYFGVMLDGYGKILNIKKTL